MSNSRWKVLLFVFPCEPARLKSMILFFLLFYLTLKLHSLKKRKELLFFWLCKDVVFMNFKCFLRYSNVSEDIKSSNTFLATVHSMYMFWQIGSWKWLFVCENGFLSVLKNNFSYWKRLMRIEIKILWSHDKEKLNQAYRSRNFKNNFCVSTYIQWNQPPYLSARRKLFRFKKATPRKVYS